MKLTNETKQLIINEYNEWFNQQYGDKTIEERKELDAFFTPPELTIMMIEQFDSIENKTILDPTCGSGNLLAGCILAGADPKLIYGNELDEELLTVCKNRLTKLGVPESNLHRGDATVGSSYDFTGKKSSIITKVELW